MQDNTPPASLGLIDPQWVHPSPEALDRATIDRFLALEDLSGTVSDVLDALGVQSTVGASLLRPTMAAARIVGQAVTVRNVAQTNSPLTGATTGHNSMAEIEGIRQARAGEVLVIQGMPDVSNMGGIIAGIARHQQLAGAVVDGGVRDVAQSRRMGFPIWSTDISPITGKWRCVTVEVNGPVNVMGVAVFPGDLVVADETGTCFVPRRLVAEVLTRAEEITRKEREIIRTVEGGFVLTELAESIYGKRTSAHKH